MSMLSAKAYTTTASATLPQDSQGEVPACMVAVAVTELAGAAARVQILGGAVQAPAAPTGSESATAGSVDAGTHSYKVVFHAGGGSSEAGAVLSKVVSTGSKKVLLTIPTGPQGTTGRSIYRNEKGTNEVVTFTPTAGLATETFTLTFGGVDSSVVTLPVGGFASLTLAAVQAALDSIPALLGNITATGATGGPFTLTFGGSLKATNVGDITMTNKTGAADGTLVETTPGAAEGATFYRVSSGVTVADNTTETYEDGIADATLTGYAAAPSANTSGEVLADINVPASTTVMLAFPVPIAAPFGRIRAQIVSGTAPRTIVYGFPAGA